MTIRCEKCGVEAWGAVQVPMQIIRLLGGQMVELCLPCQRQWNRLAYESPEFLQLAREEFWREILMARAQGCTEYTLADIKNDNVIERIAILNRHFMDLSQKWLAEKPKAEDLKT